MDEDPPRIPRLAENEAAFGLRLGRHLGTSLKGFGVVLIMCGVVLASGNSLSKLMDVEPNSILFQLWPFNRVYLQQLAPHYDSFDVKWVAQYNASGVKWFFNVVSYCNLIWLAFLCWKIVFEIFRKDVQFPRLESSAIRNFIVAFFIAGCVLVAFFIPLNSAGFATHVYGFSGLGLNQSIAAGAVKVVMVGMTFLYFGISLIMEFGGLGIRYLLFKMFGCFAANAPMRQKVE